MAILSSFAILVAGVIVALLVMVVAVVIMQAADRDQPEIIIAIAITATLAGYVGFRIGGM